MNRQDKSEFIDSFQETIRATSLVVLASYTGIKVNQSNALRRKLSQKGVQMRVVKNTLARRALEGTPLANLAEAFTGMTAVLFVDDDPIAGARSMREAFTGVDAIKVRAGWFEGDVMDAKGIMAVADLPGRGELLSTLLCTIQEPVRQIMGVIEGPARDIAYLLMNLETELAKKEGE